MRVVRYDTYWSDGRVDFDVSLSKVMYRRYPADFADIEENVHEHCPEVGVGQRVGERGGVVEGPSLNRPRQDMLGAVVEELNSPQSHATARLSRNSQTVAP